MEPHQYSKLTPQQRKQVRELYLKEQNYKCLFCNNPLFEQPPEEITSKPLDLTLFPPNFLKHPIHLQHNHDTDMTEGEVHAYCNGYMWQYEDR